MFLQFTKIHSKNQFAKSTAAAALKLRTYNGSQCSYKTKQTNAVNCKILINIVLKSRAYPHITRNPRKCYFAK